MLNKNQLLNITGGSTNITASLVSSILEVVNVVIELGRSIGVSIRKIASCDSC